MKQNHWSFREELSIVNGIVFKGERLIILEVMRKKMLEQLHQAHMGIEKTKWRARAAILWPQINQQIKNMVKKCSNCQQNERKQQHEPMKTSMYLSVHFRWLDQIYLTGMIKILR